MSNAQDLMFTPNTLIGRTLGGQYRLEALLSRGGFGAVFRALDLQLQRHVAVKVIAHAATEQLADRFRREAQLQARLRHPTTVRLLHFGEDHGLFFMVQEYVDGTTLKAVVDKTGPMSAERVARIVSDLLDALDEAHAEGVVHRDLKPANIMVVSGRRGEEVRLLDFGIAKILEETDDIETLTASGMVIGTPAWMAPEQALRQPILPAADLYSLGCVMHYALTGLRPFQGTPIQVMLDHVKLAPPPLPEHVPSPLVDVIHCAMAKKPGDRFPSALAMKEALATALLHMDATATAPSHPPITALSEPPPDPTPLGISNISTPPQQAAGGAPGTTTLVAIVAAMAVAVALGLGWVMTNSGETVEPKNHLAASPANAVETEHLPEVAFLASADAHIPVVETIEPTDEVALAPDAMIAVPAPAPPRSPKSRRKKRAPESTPAGPRQPTDDPSKDLLRALDRQLRQCQCKPAQATLAALSDQGIERKAEWEAFCGTIQTRGALSRCARSLNSRLDKAMADCPCHDSATEALALRLKREFGIDRVSKWRRRCTMPLPNSCVK